MIRLYYKDLRGDCLDEQSLAMYGHLPKERQESVDRLKNEEMRRKRIQTGYFLQEVLSKEIGISMDELRYRYGAQGKPELDYDAMKIVLQEPIHFNMSHSGDYVVIAVSQSPVGVDIEYKSKNHLSVAKRCFHEKEYQSILSHETEKEQAKRFLEIWTMKEAYVKCSGQGMSVPFNSFDVTGEALNCRVVDAFHEMDEGYIVAICGNGDVEPKYCV